MMRKASALITCTYIAIVLLICPSTAYPLVTAKDGEWTIRFTGYLKNITTYTESINFPVSLLSEFMEDIEEHKINSIQNYKVLGKAETAVNLNTDFYKTNLTENDLKDIRDLIADRGLERYKK